MRKGPAGALECLRGHITGSWDWLGPGNTNIGLLGGYWVGTTSLPPSTRYTTLLVPTQLPHPGRRHGAHYQQYGDRGHAHMTSLTWTKEILGVDNAHVSLGARRDCLTHAIPGPAVCPSPPVGPGRAAVGLRSVLSPQIPHILSISQYFSVISQLDPRYILYLSYISVISQLLGFSHEQAPGSPSA